MAKKPKQPAPSAPSAAAAAATDRWPILAPAILFLTTLLCYWTPLTDAATSILWDAADFFQPIQNYLSTELHAGRIPFWSPYPHAGFPFLADPQVGAWYPLNWPFFLIGVAPRVLVAEHFLAALLACFGAYYLALRILNNRPAAVLAGLCYGLSGFFTGHSSHTPMLQCAGWLPWLLLLFDRALECSPETGRGRDTQSLKQSAAPEAQCRPAKGSPLRNTVLGGFVASAMILAGHFQSALYGFFALALFAAARFVASPARWPRILAIAFAMPFTGALLSAIATGPGFELASHSIRTGIEAVHIDEGHIPLEALLTLILPDYYGAASGHYHGPPDITQFYFYAGILLLPLAAFGLTRPSMRLPALLLFLPALWYAMGASAGLYLLIARLPGFASVRAPVNIWFVPALGLALLASAGFAAATGRWRLPWLAPALLAIAAINLFYSNSASNQLAYSRTPYDQLYGQGEDLFRRATAQLPPLTRFDAPEHLPSFGPLAHYFDTRTEVTYGYNPLELSLYNEYYAAMQRNPKLRDGLAVGLFLNPQTGAVQRNPGVLPRAMFPRQIVAAPSPAVSPDVSRRLLDSLDPSQQAIAPAGVHVTQDAAATARVTEFAPGHYKIHYHCATDSVLRVSNAWFDGWTANGWTVTAGARALTVFPVDHALIGLIAPAGDGDIVLDYHSTYFAAGAAVSAAALLACLAVLALTRKPANP